MTLADVTQSPFFVLNIFSERESDLAVCVLSVWTLQAVPQLFSFLDIPSDHSHGGTRYSEWKEKVVQCSSQADINPQSIRLDGCGRSVQHAADLIEVVVLSKAARSHPPILICETHGASFPSCIVALRKRPNYRTASAFFHAHDHPEGVLLDFPNVLVLDFPWSVC